MNFLDIVFPNTQPVNDPSPWGWIVIGGVVFLGLAAVAFLILKNRRG